MNLLIYRVVQGLSTNSISKRMEMIKFVFNDIRSPNRLKNDSLFLDTEFLDSRKKLFFCDEL